MIQSTGATVRRKRARWRRAWPIRSPNKRCSMSLPIMSAWPNAPKTAGREKPRNLRPGLNRVGDAVTSLCASPPSSITLSKIMRASYAAGPIAAGLNRVSIISLGPRPSATLVRDRRLGGRRVSRVLLDAADEIECGVERLVVLRIRRDIGLRAGLLVAFGLEVAAQRSF